MIPALKAPSTDPTLIRYSRTVAAGWLAHRLTPRMFQVQTIPYERDVFPPLRLEHHVIRYESPSRCGKANASPTPSIANAYEIEIRDTDRTQNDHVSSSGVSPQNSESLLPGASKVRAENGSIARNATPRNRTASASNIHQ